MSVGGRVRYCGLRRRRRRLYCSWRMLAELLPLELC
jgi:hypothetical protein